MNRRVPWLPWPDRSLWHAMGSQGFATDVPWLIPEGKQVFWTRRGRTAVHLAMRGLGLDADDEMLVPDWCCGSEVDAILASGCAVRCYPIDSDMRWSIDELIDRVTPKTRGVYLIDYGSPDVSTLLRAAEECRLRGLRVVLDAALSLSPGECLRRLVMAVDASIFSFGKALAVPEGGAVRFSDPVVPTPTLNGLLRREVETSARMIRRALVRGRVAVRRGGDAGGPPDQAALLGQFPEMPASYYFSLAGDRCAGIALSASWLIRRHRLGWIAGRRVQNRQALLAALTDAGANCMHIDALAQSDSPLALFLKVDAARRDALVLELNRRGIGCVAWWRGVHPMLSAQLGPGAVQLKREAIALPVHQCLSESDMMYVAENVVDATRGG